MSCASRRWDGWMVREMGPRFRGDEGRECGDAR